ncbi:hypothetical protein AB6N01_20470 [Alcaligenes nematophilus]|uniref:hypothetical protein n=1 Tax=Alcaligenes nematophilus TaxID=2994643 RepID=UPI0034E091C4
MDKEFLTTLLSAIAAISTTVTAGAAFYLSYRSDRNQRKKEADEFFIDRCEVYLSRAYDVLASGEGGNALPNVPSRLDWLTAARMIEEYKKVAPTIRLEQNKLKIEARKEYWRTRITNLFSRFDFDVSYFSINRSNGVSVSPIAPISARIIFDFLEWPEGKKDPLDQVNEEELRFSLRYTHAINAINANARRSAGGIIAGAVPPADPPPNV